MLYKRNLRYFGRLGLFASTFNGEFVAQSWGFNTFAIKIHLLVARSPCRISSCRIQNLRGSFLLFCHSVHRAFWEWRNCSFGTWGLACKWPDIPLDVQPQLTWKCGSWVHFQALNFRQPCTVAQLSHLWTSTTSRTTDTRSAPNCYSW